MEPEAPMKPKTMDLTPTWHQLNRLAYNLAPDGPLRSLLDELLTPCDFLDRHNTEARKAREQVQTKKR
jgi:hypothetical protein